ncbi:MAG TPA: LemA family protein [Thermomicrobiales bacterium]|nr:LemA family protein [Thermomicrobiales bacterium]
MLWIIVGAVVALIVLFLIFTYNRLVGRRNQVRNAWGQIDVQLTRRHDLIPNLVNAVKGYLEHERGVLERVTEARAAAIAAGGDVERRAEAENQVTQALRSVFAVAEGYPQLRASENMLSLQEELSSTENRIAFARQHYNDSVMEYNTSRETFPAVLVAGALGFRHQALFQLDAAAPERAVPQVQF